jgi:hypothetical protein
MRFNEIFHSQQAYFSPQNCRFQYMIDSANKLLKTLLGTLQKQNSQLIYMTGMIFVFIF